MNRAVGTVHFNVAVYRMQLFDPVYSRHDHRPVHRAKMFDPGAVRYMDRVFHRHLHSFVLRIVGCHRNTLRGRIHFDRHSRQVGLLELRRFYRMDFDHILVPALNLHGSIHVLQFKRAARLQRKRAIVVFRDREARNSRGRQREHQHHCRNQHLAKFHNRSPSRIRRARNVFALSRCFSPLS